MFHEITLVSDFVCVSGCLFFEMSCFSWFRGFLCVRRLDRSGLCILLASAGKVICFLVFSSLVHRMRWNRVTLDAFTSWFPLRLDLDRAFAFRFAEVHSRRHAALSPTFQYAMIVPQRIRGPSARLPVGIPCSATCSVSSSSWCTAGPSVQRRWPRRESCLRCMTKALFAPLLPEACPCYALEAALRAVVGNNNKRS
jgi:hypothetical protein